MEKIFILLLNLLKVTYTTYFVRHFLKLNRHWDTTLLVSSFLDQYQIESMAVQFTTNELQEVEYPILAVMQEGTNKEEYVILTSIKDGHVNILKSNGKTEQKTLQVFNNEWTGRAILIDAENKQTEPNYLLNKKTEYNANHFNILTIGLGIGLLAFLVYSLSDTIPYISLPLLATKIAGLFLSIELIKKSTGVHTAFSERVCNASKNTNCNQVLRSPAAKIWGISLSDIGFLYFGVTFILLWLTSVDHFFYTLLLSGTVCTLPFTVFSIFYQWKNVKAWCSLCLITLVLFWIEFALLTQISVSINFSNHTHFLLLTILIALSVIWLFVFLKTQWKKGLNAENYAQRYHSIKNDLEITSSVIENGRQLNNLPSLNQIELDTASAQNELLVITNPFCTACMDMHEQLETFLHYFQGYISIKIIPTFNNHSLNDKVSDYMLTILSSQYQNKIAHINKWYQLKEKDEKVFDSWKISIPEHVTTPNKNEIMKWLQLNQINYTPCLILNQRIIHPEFGLEQIKKYLKNKI